MSTVGLIWANLHRRPARTYLTLFSVLVAFLLFAVLRTMAAWFAGGDEIASANRLVVTGKYSIIDSLPYSQLQAIAAVDGVEAVTHQQWFGGNYQDPRNWFPKYPVEPRAYFDMYPELVIDPETLDAFERTRTGAVAPADLAARFGWEAGDKIPIEADIWPQKDGNRSWEFDFVGTYTLKEDAARAPIFLFQHDYFAEATGIDGMVGWYTVRIANPERAGAIAKAIDARFEHSTNPTKTATEDELARSFAAQIGDLGLMANSILSAVFFTILLLTAVVMNWTFRERVPEFAVLKTLGFSDRRVALLMLGESLLLCLLGGGAGIGLALAATPFMELSNFGISELPLHWPTIMAGGAITVGLGLLVGTGPAWLARRLTIAEALRRG